MHHDLGMQFADADSQFELIFERSIQPVLRGVHAAVQSSR